MGVWASRKVRGFQEPFAEACETRFDVFGGAGHEEDSAARTVRRDLGRLRVLFTVHFQSWLRVLFSHLLQGELGFPGPTKTGGFWLMDLRWSGAGCYSEHSVKQTRASSRGLVNGGCDTASGGMFLLLWSRCTRSKWKTRLKREDLQWGVGWVVEDHDRDG